MKKIYILIIAALVIFPSCEKFLTETSVSSITAENSLTTEEDWDKALTGAYAILQELVNNTETIPMNMLGTDEVESFNLSYAAYSNLQFWTLSSSHTFLTTFYNYCYNGIKRCNTVLDMPKSAPVGDAHRELMMAQAKFLRSYYYFNLVSLYGGVPLWTSANVDKSQIHKPRSTTDQTYELIVADMKDAAMALPETWESKSDAGRPTSGAAYALLGRYYLQWGKPAEALEFLNKIIGKYSLYSNIEDIFDKVHENEGIENIFEIQFKHSNNAGLEGGRKTSAWGPRGGSGPTAGGWGWGGIGPTQYLYDSYDPTDKRRAAWFCTEYLGVTQTPPSLWKYRDEEHANEMNDDDLNDVVIRYADVLLMKAEALNNLGDTSNEKFDCINAIRKRAGISEITKSDAPDQENFATILLKERLRELCCERLRRNDLIRFGKLKEQVLTVFPTASIGDNCNLYPIPQGAIDANDAMSDEDQNPGW